MTTHSCEYVRFDGPEVVEGVVLGAGGANLEIFELRGAELILDQVRPFVDAILGVDVFEAQSAVIDYASSSLFLRAS